MNKTPPSMMTMRPDTVPNRFLSASDWSDPRYATLRGELESLYRDDLGGRPHPSHARRPERVVMHWSREWEYPWAVINSGCRPGMRVVDLGCGGSPLVPYLVRRVGCRGAGVDLNLTSTEGHTLRGFPRPPETVVPEATWVLASMAYTGLEAHVWDRVFCISVLEHVDEPTAAGTMMEIARLLTPEGRALITTDVDGTHRTLTIAYDRLLELAGDAGLALHGACDFRVPDATDRPGGYDVVGFMLKRAA